MPLEEKNRLILDKVFMAFGSLMKAFDKSLLDEAQVVKYADTAWAWSVRHVGQLINQAYEMEAKRRAEGEGPTNGTELPPASKPAPASKPSDADVLRCRMTPQTVEFSGEGEYRNGGKWKRYHIIDTLKTHWSAFNILPEIGVKYDVEYLLDDKGRRTIRKLVEVAEEEVRDDLEEIEEDDDSIPF